MSNLSYIKTCVLQLNNCFSRVQAAVKLKVKSRYDWDSSTYRKYFDAFADGYNTMYKNTEEPATFEETLMQTVPYALLLIFPIVLVFTLAVLKNV